MPGNQVSALSDRDHMDTDDARPAPSARFAHGSPLLTVLPTEVFQKVLQHAEWGDLKNMLATAKSIRNWGGETAQEALSRERTARQVRSDLGRMPSGNPTRSPFPAIPRARVTVSEIERAVGGLLIQGAAKESSEREIMSAFYDLKPSLADPENEQPRSQLQALMPTMAQWGNGMQDLALRAIVLELDRNPRMQGHPTDKLDALDVLLSLEIASPGISLARLMREVSWTEAAHEPTNQALLDRFLEITDTRRDMQRAVALWGLIPVVSESRALNEVVNAHARQVAQQQRQQADLMLRVQGSVAQERAQGGTPDVQALMQALARIDVVAGPRPPYMATERRLELLEKICTRVAGLNVDEEVMQVLEDSVWYAVKEFLGLDKYKALDYMLAMEIPKPAVTTTQLRSAMDWSEPAGDPVRRNMLVDFLFDLDKRSEPGHGLLALCGILPYIVDQNADSDRQEQLESYRYEVFSDIADRVKLAGDGFQHDIHARLQGLLNVFPTFRSAAENLLRKVKLPSGDLSGS